MSNDKEQNSKDGTDVTAEVDYQSEFAKLRHDFVLQSQIRLRRLKELWRMLSLVQWSGSHYQLLLRGAEQLSNNATMLGYGGVAGRARDLLDQLKRITDKGVSASNEESVTDAFIALDRVLKERLEAPQVETLPERRAEQKQATVLVIDDEPIQREWIRLHLERIGLNVQLASSLHEAIEWLEESEQTIALTIIDIFLPDESYISAEEVLSLRAHTSDDCPILVISPHADQFSRLSAARSGGDAFLARPLNAESFLSTALGLMRRQKSARLRVLLVNINSKGDSVKTRWLQSEIELIEVTEPKTLLRAIVDSKPQGVLMPSPAVAPESVELVRMLRQDMSLPPLWLAGFDHQGDTAPHVPEWFDTLFSAGTTMSSILTTLRSVLAPINRLQRLSGITARKSRSEGAVNRPYFLRLLERINNAAQGVTTQWTLVHIALTQVNTLKNEYGILVASEFQAQLGKTISQHLKADDVYCFLSDDSIALLLSPRSDEVMNTFSRECCAMVLSHPITVEGQQFNPHVLVGLIRVTGGEPRIGQLLQHVEQASVEAAGNAPPIKWAKTAISEGAKNQVVEHIGKTLPQEKLSVCYQVIADIIKPDERAFEVFVRLRANDDRRLFLEDFVEELNQKKLEPDLDCWQTIHVLTQITSVFAKTKGMFLIHISRRTIMHPHWLKFLGKLSQKYHKNTLSRVGFWVDAEWAEIHIGELKTIFASMQQLGFKTGLFDLDVASERINELATLPLNWVKLEVESDDSAAALSGLPSRWRGQELKLIISNIENAQQMARYWRLGYRYFQGEFIDPVSDEIDKTPVNVMSSVGGGGQSEWTLV